MSAENSTARTEPPAYGPGTRLIQRMLVWLAVISVIFILRSFFLLMFLTFVFSYIQANGVDKLVGKVKNRTLTCVFVFMILLFSIVSLGNFLVPRVRAQAESFIAQYPQYLRTLDSSLMKASTKYPALERIFPQLSEYRELGSVTDWSFDRSPSVKILEDLEGRDSDHPGSKASNSRVIEKLRDIFGQVLASVSAFLLSLLFSFLIVLDLPRLAASARGLRDTKLRFAYDEVTPTLTSFGRVLGRALEAQMFIALLNTLLTALGVYYILGIRENVAFISVIVFICSFIPVAGVFMSSLPIFLLTLQQGGFVLTIFAGLLIIVIHMIEAYILNPKIYGAHLRMNPVVVLIILTVGGKIFGVWGLILGVPICTYIFTDAIRYQSLSKDQGEPTVAG